VPLSRCKNTPKLERFNYKKARACRLRLNGPLLVITVELCIEPDLIRGEGRGGDCVGKTVDGGDSIGRGGKEVSAMPALRALEGNLSSKTGGGGKIYKIEKRGEGTEKTELDTKKRQGA